MANYPQPIKQREELNLRLGIKSSLSQLRSIIASLYVIYKANKMLPKVIYSEEINDEGYTTIKLKETLYNDIRALYTDETFSQLVEKSPLFTSQLEALQVGIELFFHLGKVDFVKSGLSERTGSNRYQKQIAFSTNMLLIDLYLSSHSIEDVKKLLLAWLQDKAFTSKLEEGLRIMLNTFTEETQFKIRDNNSEEVIFNQEGVYAEILSSGVVSSNDTKEPVGPFRVYKSYLSSGLHPFIVENKQEIRLQENVGKDTMECYADMVDTSLSLIPKRSIVTQEVYSSNTGGTTHQQDSNQASLVSYLPYLTALRTKPFMLLAGISGTGKSRIVRELAFKSCPNYLQDEDGTTPGNYCMIEVKPNWHDSSELLGYYSSIAKQYVFTDFVKFLLKAKLYSKVPFFVCMDEMNLAPVEQYFAEFLSVLETRKQTKLGIKTGALVKGHYFKRIKSVNEYDNVQTDADVYTLLGIPITAGQKEELAKTNSLKTEGLTLPENVFVIGTVNMDDTTHQFSRKVLDRAMTIEMNGGKLTDMFGHSNDLEYLPEENVWKIDQFKPKYVNADEVLEEHIDSNGDLDETGIALKTQLSEKLDAINDVLEGTPFVVSYRVLNELVIYAGVLLDNGRGIEEAINEAVDRITLMKILPRIEGDEDMLGNAKDENNRLCRLMKVVGPKSQEKLREMNRRLESGFTRFWP
jgi:hypothetical protein